MNTCPYCLSPMEDRESAVACEICGAAHHTECWEENGGCAMKECRQARGTLVIDLPKERRDRIDISREALESVTPGGRRTPTNPCMGCGVEVAEDELYCPRCAQEPEENQDSRNVGPMILVLLSVLAVILAWLVIETVSPPVNPESAREAPVEDIRR